MQHNLRGLKINKSTHQSNTDSSAALKKETRAEACPTNGYKVIQKNQ